MRSRVPAASPMASAMSSPASGMGTMRSRSMSAPSWAPNLAIGRDEPSVSGHSGHLDPPGPLAVPDRSCEDRSMPDASLLLLLDEVRGKTLRILDAAPDGYALWAPAGLQNHILWH